METRASAAGLRAWVSVIHWPTTAGLPRSRVPPGTNLVACETGTGLYLEPNGIFEMVG